MDSFSQQVKPETAQMIESLADANGLSVDDYLRILLGMSVPTQGASETSLDEFKAAMESLAEGTEHLPSSRSTYPREDIYFDHD